MGGRWGSLSPPPPIPPPQPPSPSAQSRTTDNTDTACGGHRCVRKHMQNLRDCGLDRARPSQKQSPFTVFRRYGRAALVAAGVLQVPPSVQSVSAKPYLWSSVVKHLDLWDRVLSPVRAGRDVVQYGKFHVHGLPREDELQHCCHPLSPADGGHCLRGRMRISTVLQLKGTT